MPSACFGLSEARQKLNTLVAKRGRKSRSPRAAPEKDIQLISLVAKTRKPHDTVFVNSEPTSKSLRIFLFLPQRTKVRRMTRTACNGQRFLFFSR